MDLVDDNIMVLHIQLPNQQYILDPGDEGKIFRMIFFFFFFQRNKNKEKLHNEYL